MNLFKTEPAAPPIPPISLSADDAAKCLGISKKMLQAMADAGEIPVVEFSRQTKVFDLEDLRALIAARKKTKTPKKG